jgi:hypothetical protein
MPHMTLAMKARANTRCPDIGAVRMAGGTARARAIRLNERRDKARGVLSRFTALPIRCETADFQATKAYRLPAKYGIHAVRVRLRPRHLDGTYGALTQDRDADGTSDNKTYVTIRDCCGQGSSS